MAPNKNDPPAPERAPGGGQGMSKREALLQAYRKELRRQYEASPDDEVDEGAVIDAILAELREPDEGMRRAWIVASCSDDFDPDQQEPVPGTGQGDLRYAPAWENMWDTLDCWTRHRAMFDALITELPK